MNSLLGACLASVVLVASLAACNGGDSQESVPALTTAELQDPSSCQKCHPDQHREWSGSMHAYASEDPIFRAMNARGQRETKGQLGDFCVKCHAPMALKEGKTTDGTNLDDVPQSLHGVTCFYCHSADKVTGTHNAPIDLATDGVMRASIENPVKTGAHVAEYAKLLDRDQTESASLCGSCHDIVNMAGAHIERTFTEWKGTVFAKPPAELTCGACHMASKQGLAAQAPGVFLRKVHSHEFPGVDTALTPSFPEVQDQKIEVQSFLDTTLQSALCVQTIDGVTRIKLVLDNVGAGHSFPSGAAQDRRAWAEIEASYKGKVVYQSGVVPQGKGVTDITDPDLWLIRDCMLGADKKPVDMFWQAVTTKSVQLPGPTTIVQTDPAFYATHVVQTYPRDASLKSDVDKVTAKVHLVPVGLDVLDDLVESGDLDAKVRDAMGDITLAGTDLEWTPKAGLASGIDYIDEGQPVTCVTIGLTIGANTGVPAPPPVCAP